MQEVEALCTRVILIHQGNIVQDADIADFKGKFNNLEEAFAHYDQRKNRRLIVFYFSFCGQISAFSHSTV